MTKLKLKILNVWKVQLRGFPTVREKINLTIASIKSYNKEKEITIKNIPMMMVKIKTIQKLFWKMINIWVKKQIIMLLKLIMKSLIKLFKKSVMC